MEQIISILNNKCLNPKNNNYIFTDLTIDEISIIKSQIAPICKLRSLSSDVLIDIQRDTMKTMIVDAEIIKIDDFLNESLRFLDIHEDLPFQNKFDLLRFRGFLRQNKEAIQWIFINGENLDPIIQQRINEIFWVNTYFFNINFLLSSSNLVTYQLEDGKVLDYRENYEKIKLPRYF